MRNRFEFSRVVIAFIALCLLAACARTDISTDKEYRGEALPKPDRVIVYDFAVSPEEVKLQRGLSDRIRNLLSRTPRSEKEKELGRQVADATAAKLVEELRREGLPAERAVDNRTLGQRPLLIYGQFVSIDAGNRTERMIIGFGLGHSDVRAHVQLYETVRGKERLVDQIDANTKSGRKPGMATMMGVGGLAGHLLVSTAVSAGVGAASEALSANVKSLSGTMAKRIGKEILKFYRDQGWL